MQAETKTKEECDLSQVSAKRTQHVGLASADDKRKKQIKTINSIKPIILNHYLLSILLPVYIQYTLL